MHQNIDAPYVLNNLSLLMEPVPWRTSRGSLAPWFTVMTSWSFSSLKESLPLVNLPNTALPAYTRLEANGSCPLVLSFSRLLCCFCFCFFRSYTLSPLDLAESRQRLQLAVAQLDTRRPNHARVESHGVGDVLLCLGA